MLAGWGLHGTALARFRSLHTGKHEVYLESVISAIFFPVSHLVREVLEGAYGDRPLGRVPASAVVFRQEGDHDLHVHTATPSRRVSYQ